MSKRDKELLKITGLKITEVAELLPRSRPSIYQGVEKDKSCFKAPEATLFLHELILRDSPRIDEFIRFVESHYTPEECDVILPGRIAVNRFKKQSLNSNQIVMFFNGNIEHLKSSALLVNVLRWTIGTYSKIFSLLSPALWVQGYIAEELKIAGAYRFVTVPTDIPLSSILLVKEHEVRVFCFTRFGLVESDPGHAAKLREYARLAIE